jgi:hypothetical protein
LRLIPIADWAAVEAAERAVFAWNDGNIDPARGTPFAAAMERRAVLNLSGDFFPERDAGCIAALMAATAAIGEREIFRRSNTAGTAPDEQQRPALGIAYAVDTDASDFQRPFIAGWRAGFNFDHYRGSADRFVSPAGRWGLIFDAEGWAVIGGEQRFMAAFAGALTQSLDDELRDHLRWCADFACEHPDPADSAWIPKHIAHILGRKRAAAWLAEYGIALPLGVWERADR